MSQNQYQSNKKAGNQALRIIAGKWRHRKISFYAQAGARPTLDRVRETVFNWLTPYITNSNCLDLFAGSGILGIEALSRGASSACFIDNQPESIKLIQAAFNLLSSEDNKSENRNAIDAEKTEKTKEHSQPIFASYKNLHLPQGLSKLPNTAAVNNQFDIIFLDPPYHTDLLQQTLGAVLELNLLTSNGVVYFEAGKQDKIDFHSWEVLKHKSTKSLQYGLLKKLS